MGHYVEYFVAADGLTARERLSRHDGWMRAAATAGEPSYGEFRLLGEAVVQAEIAALATRLVVPGIKYSRIIARDPEATTTVELLDRIVSEAFGDALIIRVDELIRADWEQWADEEWWRVDDPCTSLLKWLDDGHVDPRYFSVMGTPSNGRT